MATDTHSEYVILVDFSLQKLLRERSHFYVTRTSTRSFGTGFHRSLQSGNLKMSLGDDMVGSPHFLNSELLHSDRLLFCRFPI